MTTRLLPIADVVNNWKRLQTPFFICSPENVQIQFNMFLRSYQRGDPNTIQDCSLLKCYLCTLSSFRLGRFLCVSVISGCVYSSHESEYRATLRGCWLNLQWDLEDVLAALILGSLWKFLAPYFACDSYLDPPLLMDLLIMRNWITVRLTSLITASI